MYTLYLNAEERATLVEILEECFSELKSEIYNTENWKYKAGLKHEQQVLEKTLAQLRGVEKTAAQKPGDPRFADDIIL